MTYFKLIIKVIMTNSWASFMVNGWIKNDTSSLFIAKMLTKDDRQRLITKAHPVPRWANKNPQKSHTNTKTNIKCPMRWKRQRKYLFKQQFWNSALKKLKEFWIDLFIIYYTGSLTLIEWHINKLQKVMHTFKMKV